MTEANATMHQTFICKILILKNEDQEGKGIGKKKKNQTNVKENMIKPQKS